MSLNEKALNTEQILISDISSRYIAGKPYDETVAPLVISSANGPFLVGVDSASYLDWATCLNAPFGHTDRLDTTSIPVNAGNYQSVYRYNLLSRLVELFPYIDGFQFRSSGTESVEAALRYVMAVFHHQHLKLVTLDGCYHGLTLGSRVLMGTSRDYVSSVMLPYPTILSSHEVLEKINGLLVQGPVAFFLETIQGGTLRELPKDFLDGLWLIKNKYPDRLVIICDDMLASIRCGNWCSLDGSNMTPDIVVGGKCWSNGYPFSFFGISWRVQQWEINNR
jgi:4-aminobutyrate aminotransferase-like enzyme